MKEKFKEYYMPTEEEFKSLWDNCIFVLDANILLNLYRYTKPTSDKFLNIIESHKERFWIPFHAAFEYQQNRLNTISNHIKVYGKVLEYITKKQDEIKIKFEEYTRHPSIDIKNISKRLNKYFKNIKKIIEKNQSAHPNLKEEDYIRDQLTELFIGRIGNEYEVEKMAKLEKEGELRYKNNIPPGYMDKEKDGVRQYGDFIIWQQIIDHAKDVQKPIVLITDDRKEDWWLKKDGEIIGPRPELLKEFRIKVGSGFYMYQSTEFMKYSEKYLGQENVSDAITEINKFKKMEESNRALQESMNKAKEGIEQIGRAFQSSELYTKIKEEDEQLRRLFQPSSTLMDKLLKSSNIWGHPLTEEQKQIGGEFMNKLHRDYMKSEANKLKTFMERLIEKTDDSDLPSPNKDGKDKDIEDSD